MKNLIAIYKLFIYILLIMDDLENENDKEWLNKIRNDLGHSKFESNANIDHLSMAQILQDYENEDDF